MALDGTALLTSPSLEDNLLALLCRLQNPRVAVQHLLARIASLGGQPRGCLAKLVILAGLRRLHPVVREEIQQMPITINIQENPFLRRYLRRGNRKVGKKVSKRVGKRSARRSARGSRGRQEEAAVLLGRLRTPLGHYHPGHSSNSQQRTLPLWRPGACDCSKRLLWKKCYGLPKCGASY